MSDSDSLPTTLRAPEISNGTQISDVLMYLTDLTTFAMRKLPEWKDPVVETDLADKELTALWEACVEHLKYLADVSKGAMEVGDAWDWDAVIPTVYATYERIEQLCAYGLTLLGALLHRSLKAAHYSDLQMWCDDVHSDVDELVAVAASLYEFRSQLPGTNAESDSIATSAA